MKKDQLTNAIILNQDIEAIEAFIATKKNDIENEMKLSDSMDAATPHSAPSLQLIKELESYIKAGTHLMIKRAEAKLAELQKEFAKL